MTEVLDRYARSQTTPLRELVSIYLRLNQTYNHRLERCHTCCGFIFHGCDVQISAARSRFSRPRFWTFPPRVYDRICIQTWHGVPPIFGFENNCGPNDTSRTHFFSDDSIYIFFFTIVIHNTSLLSRMKLDMDVVFILLCKGQWRV